MTTYRLPDSDIDIFQSIIDFLTPLDLQAQHTAIEEIHIILEKIYYFYALELLLDSPEVESKPRGMQLTISTDYRRITEYLNEVEIPRHFDEEFAQTAIDTVNATALDIIPRAYEPLHLLVGANATMIEDLIMPTNGYKIRVADANEIIEAVEKEIYNPKRISKIPDTKLTPEEAD